MRAELLHNQAMKQTVAFGSRSRTELWAVPVASGSAIRFTYDKWEDGPSDWGNVRLFDGER